LDHNEVERHSGSGALNIITPATVSVLNQEGPDSCVLNPGAPRSVYVGARVNF